MAYQFVYAVFDNNTTTGLWSTTGSSSGTGDASVKAVSTGTQTTLGFKPGYTMARLPNGMVVFGATGNDPLSGGLQAAFGIQLWITDGTAAGTSEIFSTIDAGGGQPGDTSGFKNFTLWNNVVLFEYNVGSVNTDYLYSTDGTTAGTIALSNAPMDDQSLGPGEGASTGPDFVYASSAGLWSTNGTANSAAIIKPTVAGTSSVIGFLPTYQMAALANGTVVFGAGDNGSTAPLANFFGVQLWATNGTAGGTVQIGSFFDQGVTSPGHAGTLSGFISNGTRVFFAFSPSVGLGSAVGLYSTNGTAADGGGSGFQFTFLNLDPTSLGPGQAAFTGSGKLIFATSQGVYASDGTHAGSGLIKATTVGTMSTLGFLPGTAMATLPDGRVVFGAQSNLPVGTVDPDVIPHGIQLWVTDGTAAGTQQIYSYVDPGMGQAGDPYQFTDFVSVGNGVEFVWHVTTNENFVFFTNGTTAGTYQIANTQVDDNSVGVGDGASPICFLPGTRIATPNGEVAIEDLAVGDAVTVLSGQARTIRWVGHGKVLAPRGQRNVATPVIVRQHAFADDVPNRDLHVTKAHSFLIDGALIPAEFLVNHRSIVWDDAAREVELFHIELDSHDVILANGAPAETYRDDSNRWMFRNANTGWHLPPQAPFAPVLTGGPMVDGVRIDPARFTSADAVFFLPQRPHCVRIVSRSVVPDVLGVARDPRTLGVAVRRIALWRGRHLAVIQADDARLSEGFNGYEPIGDQRWTDGDARLPSAIFDGTSQGRIELVVTLGSTTRYVAPIGLAA